MFYYKKKGVVKLESKASACKRRAARNAARKAEVLQAKAEKAKEDAAAADRLAERNRLHDLEAEELRVANGGLPIDPTIAHLGQVGGKKKAGATPLRTIPVKRRKGTDALADGREVGRLLSPAARAR